MGQDLIRSSSGDITSVTAGTGLDLNGSTFTAKPTYQLPQGCHTNEIAKWDGSASMCQADQTLSQLTTLVARADQRIGIQDNRTNTLVTSVNTSSAGISLVIAKGALLLEGHVDSFSGVTCWAAGDQMRFGSAVLNYAGGARIPYTGAAYSEWRLHCIVE